MVAWAAAAPWIAAAASSLLSAGSYGMASSASAHDAKVNRAFQKEMLDKQQNFIERMSNTAHQREVEDLNAAGLNPILSANGGATTIGAGTSSGSMPNRPNPPQFNLMEAANLQNQTRALDIQNTASNYQNEKVLQEANLIKQQTDTEFQNTQLKTLQVAGQQLDNLLKQKDLDWYDKKVITELKATMASASERLSASLEHRANTELTKVEKYRRENTPLYQDKYGIHLPFGTGIDFTVNKKNGKEPHYVTEKMSNGKMRKVKIY